MIARIPAECVRGTFKIFLVSILLMLLEDNHFLFVLDPCFCLNFYITLYYCGEKMEAKKGQELLGGGNRP